MKRLSTLYCLSLALLFALSSCSEKEVFEEVDQGASPQLSSNCNNGLCHIGGFNTMNMMGWAPYVESALNSCHLEGASSGDGCTITQQTQAKTYTMCWLDDVTYGNGAANNEVCVLKDWATQNRPPSTYNTFPQPFGINEWKITAYEYETIPEHPCQDNCANAIPLQLKVTYTKFKCGFVVHSNHNLEVVKLDVDGGGPGHIGDGHVSMDFKLRSNDPSVPDPICGELRVIDPHGAPYIIAPPSGPNADGNQHVEFDMVDFEMLECSFEFVEQP